MQNEEGSPFCFTSYIEIVKELEITLNILL